MALTEKKIEIIEAYLAIKCRNKGAAVKTIDPTIKNPNAYAWKIFNDTEVKAYLWKRRKEILLESGLDMEIVTKALTKNLYGSLGLMERTVLAHGKNGFDTITGKYEDSGSVKNYWGILKDIFGSEISGILAEEEIRENKEHDIKLKDLKTSDNKFKLEKQEKILKANTSVLNLELQTGNTDIEEDIQEVQNSLDTWTKEVWKDENNQNT